MHSIYSLSDPNSIPATTNSPHFFYIQASGLNRSELQKDDFPHALSALLLKHDKRLAAPRSRIEPFAKATPVATCTAVVKGSCASLKSDAERVLVTALVEQLTLKTTLFVIVSTRDEMENIALDEAIGRADRDRAMLNPAKQEAIAELAKQDASERVGKESDLAKELAERKATGLAQQNQHDMALAATDWSELSLKFQPAVLLQSDVLLPEPLLELAPVPAVAADLFELERELRQLRFDSLRFIKIRQHLACEMQRVQFSHLLAAAPASIRKSLAPVATRENGLTSLSYVAVKLQQLLSLASSLSLAPVPALSTKLLLDAALVVPLEHATGGL